MLLMGFSIMQERDALRRMTQATMAHRPLFQVLPFLLGASSAHGLSPSNSTFSIAVVWDAGWSWFVPFSQSIAILSSSDAKYKECLPPSTSCSV